MPDFASMPLSNTLLLIIDDSQRTQPCDSMAII